MQWIVLEVRSNRERLNMSDQNPVDDAEKAGIFTREPFETSDDEQSLDTSQKTGQAWWRGLSITALNPSLNPSLGCQIETETSLTHSYTL